MALLPGSSALDVAGATPLTRDQRGAPRSHAGGPDIGAFERIASGIIVTATADSGVGSLRSAIVFSPAGSTITFDTPLNGATIGLTSGELTMPAHSLTIDAFGLPDGVAISGSNSSRVFHVVSGSTTILDHLTIKDGQSSSAGGGLLNQGDLTLRHVTVSGNSAVSFGGGIENQGPLLVVNSTFSGNHSNSDGGAFDLNGGTLTLVNSTVSDNSSGTDGGGMWQFGTTYIENSIIASNTATGSGNDIFMFSGTVVPTGANLVGNNDTITNVFPSGPLVGTLASPLNPLLGALSDNGGPTFTMALLAGSPAIDAGGVTTLITDQRGAPRSAGGSGPDIGAFEVITTALQVTTTADAGLGSLRDATTFSPSSSTITFDPSLSGATITNLTDQLTVYRSMAIDASALPGGLTVSGNNAWRVFEVFQPVTFSGFTITGGNANGHGGALYNYAVTTLNNMTLFGNTATGNGGAIFSVSGLLTLNNVTLTGNSGVYGGAIRGAGSLALVNSTIVSNTATISGGGIDSSSPLAMMNSIIAANSAPTGPDVRKSGAAIVTTGVNLVGDLSDSTLSAGATVLVGAPLLAPLGDFGGPTRTMPPLFGSLAIDAGGPTALASDQRGAWRQGQPDIGAVEYISVVTNVADSGDGTLRDTIHLASPAATITFDGVPGGSTIALSSGQLRPERDLTIDASSLSGGVAVDAGDSSRLFEVTSGRSLTLRGLVLTNGYAVDGGAIYNEGTLILLDMTLSGNNGIVSGGAIFNDGSGAHLTLERSTLSGNHADIWGGAIFNSASASMTLGRSTLSGNTAAYGGAIFCRNDGGPVALLNTTVCSNSANFGGAIYVDSPGLTLQNSTLSGNSAANQGGGIYALSSAFSMENTILGGNSAPGGPDLYKNSGTTTLLGMNLLSDLTDSLLSAGNPGLLVGDPLLAALADNGGRTHTMALLSGSPALDAGLFIAGSSPATDQRGIERRLGGVLDIGAYERSTLLPTSVNLAAQWGTNGIPGAFLWVSTDSNFPSGITVSTLAGTNVEGYADGVYPAGLLRIPYGVAVASNGTLFVGDAGDIRIRRMLSNGSLGTLAGSGLFDYVDGASPSAAFAAPMGVAVDSVGAVYVADSENHRIRKVTPSGTVSTVAGSGTGFADGPAYSAKFACPTGVARDGSGNLYVADMLNNRIRKISAGGQVTTVAGSSTPGSADGQGAAASFNHPFGIALGGDGNLYVTDRDNHLVRKVTPTGYVTTQAGEVSKGLHDSSNPLTARFAYPTGIAVDRALNIYVADRDNHCIRMITTNGVTTIAGTNTIGFVNGDGAAARFSSPVGVAVDGQFDLYVADANNHCIRKISTQPKRFSDVTVAGGDFTAQLQNLAPGTTYYYYWEQEGTNIVGATRSFTTGSPGIAVHEGADTNAPLLTSGQPSPLAFGVTARDIPVWRTITLANTGTFDLTVSGITSPPGYTVPGFTPGTLAPGATLTLQLQFVSATVGAFSGSVVITSDAVGTPQFSLPVLCTVASPPTVVTQPADTLLLHDATLHASVNPAGYATDVTFTYSTDADLAGPLEVHSLAGSGTNGLQIGTGAFAEFNAPQGVAIDSNGVVYVADQLNHRIRRVYTNGFAESFTGYGIAGFQDGSGPEGVRFNHPTGVALASDGTLYVADMLNHRIRKVTSGGVVTTLAGSGTAGFLDGAAGTAQFLLPTGVAVDAAGRVYVADAGNNRVRLIATNGVVSTLAGSGVAGFANGAATTTAKLNAPQGVAVNAAGTIVYIADRDNHRIRAIQTGQVTTLAGQGTAGYLDGAGTTARFSSPSGIALTSDGQLLVADRDNHCIRKIAIPGGVVTTLAGSTMPGYADVPGPSGRLEPATHAQFTSPNAIAVNAAGRMAVADTGNARIRSLSRGTLETVLVTPALTGLTDQLTGFAVSDRFEPDVTYYFRAAGTNIGGRSEGAILSFMITRPTIAVHAGDTVAAAEVLPAQLTPISIGATAQNTPIQKTFTIANSGNLGLTISVIAAPAAGFGISGAPASVAPTSTATFVVTFTAATAGPHTGVVLIISDAVNKPVFTFPVDAFVHGMPLVTTLPATTVSTNSATLNASVNPLGSPTTVSFEYSVASWFPPEGDVSTFAGSGATNPVLNGAALSATFNRPGGVAIDAASTIYVADTGNHVIRKISAAGVVSTLAGSGLAGFANGTGAAAQFNGPTALAVDAAGNVYVADTENQRIRKITPAGVVTTLAGFGFAGFADGEGVGALFDTPLGVAVDGDGNVYVADSENRRIRKITPLGVVSTFAGSGIIGGDDGPAETAEFWAPVGVAIDGNGTLYVADRGLNRVRTITPAGVVSTIDGANFTDLSCIAVDALGNVVVAQPDVPALYAIRAGADIRTYLAGSFSPGYTNGYSAYAAFNEPSGVAVDPFGTVYVADTDNNRIRKFVSYTTRVTVPTPLAATNGWLAVSVGLTGLTPDEQYYFRAFGRSAYGSTNGLTESFFASLSGSIGSWRGRYFGSAENSGAGANDQNADSGALLNWVEYVFGLDPFNDADDLLPRWSRDGDVFTITYRRPKGAADVTYEIVRTDDLPSGFAPIAVTELIGSVDTWTEEVEVRITIPGAGPGAFFYQLKATTTFTP